MIFSWVWPDLHILQFYYAIVAGAGAVEHLAVAVSTPRGVAQLHAMVLARVPLAPTGCCGQRLGSGSTGTPGSGSLSVIFIVGASG